MRTGQRLAAWAATLVVIVAAALFAWRATQPVFPPLSLREPRLPLPDPNVLMSPTATGVPMMLVVIENAPEARPQAGLADACFVYAMPTEGRITRFLAAYCRRSPAMIGPVRSARKYMLDLAADVGAILVHAGQSSEAMAHIAGRRLPVINQFWLPDPFWRDPARPMPHNLYTSYDGLIEALAKKPVRLTPRPLPVRYSYDALAALPDSAPATTVTLDYGPLYGVRYVFDPARRRYLREQDGRPHVDADGQQVAPRSVLVLSIRWEGYLLRGVPASRIDLTSGGRLVILTEGRMSEGTWSRSANGPLMLKHAGGAPLALPPGPVWIELFPRDSPIAATMGEGPNGR